MARAPSKSRSAKSGGKNLALWLGLAAVVVLLDQFTKVLVVSNFPFGDVAHGHLVL